MENNTNQKTLDKARIKNIILDLGGVLLHINFQATHRAFEALGIADAASHFTQHHASDLFERLEIGTVSPTAFYKEFREVTQTKISDLQIEQAWNAMLLDFSKENIAWLSRIGHQYNTYLFSNTNQVHYDYFAAQFIKTFDGRRLESLFKKAWFSHEIGIRKPHPEAFRKLIALEGLNAAETLFIDDTLGNIKGADMAGLQTLLLKNPADLHQLDL